MDSAKYGQNIFYNVAASVVSFNLICNMTTFRKRYSLTFWPHSPGQGFVCEQYVCYNYAASVVSFNLICNMTTFRKIYSLTFWPHSPGQGFICEQNVCYNYAASVVTFNLICNMTMFWQKFNFGLGPTQWTQTQALELKFRLICFISIAALPACKLSAKNINNCLSNCEIKIFDPLGGVKGDGVKLWHCHAYLQALGNHRL